MVRQATQFLTITEPAVGVSIDLDEPLDTNLAMGMQTRMRMGTSCFDTNVQSRWKVA
ncbi:MAG TPA: hypothetical protein VLU38_01930 [Methanomassiliicoccales archaeon]|nr:hypothetical protein [Methanomassiliicoccales archaeon]